MGTCRRHTVAPADGTNPGGRVSEPVPTMLASRPATVAPAGSGSGEGVALSHNVAAPSRLLNRTATVCGPSLLQMSPAMGDSVSTTWLIPTPCAS